jgi:formylglycine-generating enzyme required for sulfatase activity
MSERKPSAQIFFIARNMLVPILLTGFMGCYDYSLSEQDGGMNTATDSNSNTHTDLDPDTDCINGEKTAGVAGLTWVAICGGRFEMGSVTVDDEKPVHTVRVPTFEMLETEVTVAQYRACVQVQSCTEPQSGGAGANWGVADRENYPINYVTWYQAEKYCAWAGGRLPSEAEWEYAASNGSAENIYPWGDETATCDYAVMDDDTHTDGCDLVRTWEVCSKTAGNTSHGLCDMAGNVREWVQDWHHGSYDCDANPGAASCAEGGVAPTDGSAWEDPGGSARVVRGGNFYQSATYMRATNRADDVPSGQYDYLGFRCAR